jgi:hypothetical protein
VPETQPSLKKKKNNKNKKNTNSKSNDNNNSSSSNQNSNGAASADAFLSSTSSSDNKNEQQMKEEEDKIRRQKFDWNETHLFFKRQHYLVATDASKFSKTTITVNGEKKVSFSLSYINKKINLL